MTLRIPLVINAGQIEQLQAGDQILAPLATTDIRVLQNGQVSGSITIGQAVYISAASAVKLALGNAISTADVIGLVYDATIANAASGNIAVGGVLTATTTQWSTVITGAPSGLTAGAIYYLDPTTAGNITTTAPTTVGQVVTQIGTALNTTDLDINIQKNILL